MRKLIDGCQVATMCDVSLSTLYRWMKDGHGFPPPVRISRKMVRWDEQAVQEWLASR
jgi:predicted DNA-binding transcriptional regulator AlpA